MQRAKSFTLWRMHLQYRHDNTMTAFASMNVFKWNINSWAANTMAARDNDEAFHTHLQAKIHYSSVSPKQSIFRGRFFASPICFPVPSGTCRLAIRSATTYVRVAKYILQPSNTAPFKHSVHTREHEWPKNTNHDKMKNTRKNRKHLYCLSHCHKVCSRKFRQRIRLHRTWRECIFTAFVWRITFVKIKVSHRIVYPCFIFVGPYRQHLSNECSNFVRRVGWAHWKWPTRNDEHIHMPATSLLCRTTLLRNGEVLVFRLHSPNEWRT